MKEKYGYIFINKIFAYFRILTSMIFCFNVILLLLSKRGLFKLDIRDFLISKTINKIDNEILHSLVG